MDPCNHLAEKAAWVRRETLKLHAACPETRLAASLSCVEILCTLFYGSVVRHNPKEPAWEGRDRFIISKGHGSISFYPVLADLGYFPRYELDRIGRRGGLLKVIPDTLIPGYESINGSVGQGLGTACGMALGLRSKDSDSRVFVLCGEGEFHEGALWEAIMFAGHHRLSNLILVLDQNQRCMLGWSEDFVRLNPIDEKFRAFGWDVQSVDGHDVRALHAALVGAKTTTTPRPRAVVANTIKGKGVPRLETDPLCHVRSLTPAEIAALLKELP